MVFILHIYENWAVHGLASVYVLTLCRVFYSSQYFRRDLTYLPAHIASLVTCSFVAWIILCAHGRHLSRFTPFSLKSICDFLVAARIILHDNASTSKQRFSTGDCHHKPLSHPLNWKWGNRFSPCTVSLYGNALIAILAPVPPSIFLLRHIMTQLWSHVCLQKVTHLRGLTSLSFEHPPLCRSCERCPLPHLWW